MFELKVLNWKCGDFFLSLIHNQPPCIFTTTIKFSDMNYNCKHGAASGEYDLQMAEEKEPQPKISAFCFCEPRDALSPNE